MQNRIAAACVAGFVIGILVRSLLSSGGFVCVALCFIALLMMLVAYVGKNSTAVLVGVFLLACAGGVLRMELAPHEMHPSLQERVGSEIQIEGSVVVEPDVREGAQRITVEFEIDGVTQRTLVVAEPYPRITYGDVVQAAGMLAVPEPFSAGEGRVFRYDAFLAKDGIFSIVYRPHIEVVGVSSGLYVQVRRTLSEMRNTFFRAIEVGIPEPHASLAQGLVMGGKQGLGTELLDAFTLAGLVHIVVLSGYNVMIVAEMILRSFGFMQKRIAALAALVVVAAFVLAAGAGPASIRAGIMAGLSLLARFTGRTYDVVRALLVAMVLMLLHSPYLLMFDPGFQLSFIATLGLVVGVPLLLPLFQWIRSAFFRDMLASTLAAQIAVLPLLLYQTGLLSIVSLPANLLVLPVIPVAMFLSMVAAVSALLLPTYAYILSFPAYMLLEYVIRIAELSARVPHAGVIVPAFPFWFVIIAYLCLCGFVLKRMLPPLMEGAFLKKHAIRLR